LISESPIPIPHKRMPPGTRRAIPNMRCAILYAALAPHFNIARLKPGPAQSHSIQPGQNPAWAGVPV
jgi:hypothetical protein